MTNKTYNILEADGTQTEKQITVTGRESEIASKFFVLFSRGHYSGNGTGNDRVYVTTTEPRYNQTNETPEKYPAWLGNTNGISTTALAEYPTEDRAVAGARYYARKYNCVLS